MASIRFVHVGSLFANAAGPALVITLVNRGRSPVNDRLNRASRHHAMRALRCSFVSLWPEEL